MDVILTEENQNSRKRENTNSVIIIEPKKILINLINNSDFIKRHSKCYQTEHTYFFDNSIKEKKPNKECEKTSYSLVIPKEGSKHLTFSQRIFCVLGTYYKSVLFSLLVCFRKNFLRVCIRNNFFYNIHFFFVNVILPIRSSVKKLQSFCSFLTD